MLSLRLALNVPVEPRIPAALIIAHVELRPVLAESRKDAHLIRRHVLAALKPRDLAGLLFVHVILRPALARLMDVPAMVRTVLVDKMSAYVEAQIAVAEYWLPVPAILQPANVPVPDAPAGKSPNVPVEIRTQSVPVAKAIVDVVEQIALADLCLHVSVIPLFAHVALLNASAALRLIAAAAPAALTAVVVTFKTVSVAAPGHAHAGIASVLAQLLGAVTLEHAVVPVRRVVATLHVPARRTQSAVANPVAALARLAAVWLEMGRVLPLAERSDWPKADRIHSYRSLDRKSVV